VPLLRSISYCSGVRRAFHWTSVRTNGSMSWAACELGAVAGAAKLPERQISAPAVNAMAKHDMRSWRRLRVYISRLYVVDALGVYTLRRDCW
jgi:hypothetical protein